MTSSCPPPAATSPPGLVNTDVVIAEAILSRSTFKKRDDECKYTCCCLAAICFNYCVLFPLLPYYGILALAGLTCRKRSEEPRRLYLTQSSIVFCAGDLKRRPEYIDFSIGLSNIKFIKTIDSELYRNGCCRSEVRTYSDLIIQLKEDSSEKIYMYGYKSCTCIKFDVDSFYHVCSNGDDFVQAVKQQIAAINIEEER